MKQLIILSVFSCLLSCGNSKSETTTQKKVVCDSVDTEVFDELGNSYMLKMPGKCDTVEVVE